MLWGLIEAAHGDRDTFISLLAKLSKEDIRSAYSSYVDAAESLLSMEHRALSNPEMSESESMSIANWVVMQGFEYYEKVYMDPTQTPLRSEISPKTYAAEMILFFSDTYGEWI